MLIECLNLQKRTIEALHKKNIYTTDDIVRHIPYKYLDYRKYIPLKESVGKDCLISGYLQCYSKKSNYIQAELIEESCGEKVTVTWFGCSNKFDYVKSLAFKQIAVGGKIEKHDRYGYIVSNPYYFIEKDQFNPHIVPVYRSMKGVSEKMIKNLINKCLNLTNDPLEREIIEKSKLPEYKDALAMLHYPKSFKEIQQASHKLIFNDLLYFCLQIKRRKISECQTSSIRVTKQSITKSFIKMLPEITGIDAFALTPDQKAAVEMVCNDMVNGRRANYLIQGDVSCGKTIVAVICMFLMAENGYQSVIMVPSTVLAKQHYLEIKQYAERFGFKTALLSSEVKVREAKSFEKGIAAGEYQFIVGTQKVISESVTYHNLGLVVTDEEHRFGVRQREGLEKKAAMGAHIISMTATPIPRSIADAVYGEDKKMCSIKSMPNGRIPVQTAINSSDKVIYDFVEKQLKTDHQCYVVCPLIHEEETEDETEVSKAELHTVLDTYAEYSDYFEPLGYHVGMINGKMQKEEIAYVLNDFKDNKIQILVSTTIIEVGVNVPNANVIIINNAERFGLAQLHQLRGRVGRGKEKSYCILKSEYRDNPRLNVLCSTTDGAVIAKEDSQLRGMGDLLGTKQSGNNHFIQILMDMPNLYECVKKYADWMLHYHMGSAFLSLYEENELAKEKYKTEKAG